MKTKLLKIISVLFIFLLTILIARYCLTKLYPRNYSEYVEKYAKQYNLDSNLIYAIIECESNFEQNSNSHAGAIGLMQITPSTFNWAKEKAKQTDLDDNSLYSPEINIRYGCFIYSLFSDEFKDTSVALACYNAGRGNVKKWLKDARYSNDGKTLKDIPFDETKLYINKVLNVKMIYDIIY